jgi:hypothetical protein
MKHNNPRATFTSPNARPGVWLGENVASQSRTGPHDSWSVLETTEELRTSSPGRSQHA